MPDAAVAPPHRNGSLVGGGDAPRSPWRRRLAFAGAVAFAGAWAVALVYSMTRPAPEEIDGASRARVVAACEATGTGLRHLPPLGDEPSAVQRAVRVERENARFAEMVATLRAVRPEGGDGRIALARWLDDWEALVQARADYARDLRAGADPALVLPAERAAPITITMDDFARQHGLGACTTAALQAEVVEGARQYGEPGGSGDG